MVYKFECTLANTNVWILQAFHYRCSMTLKSRHGIIRFTFHDGIVLSILLLINDASSKCVERNVANVIVAIQEKTTKDIDSQYAQAVVTFHSHDGLDAFIKNGVSSVLCRFRIGGNLRQDIVHFFGSLFVVGPQETQKRQDLDLQKGIGNSRHFIISRVSGTQHVSKHTNQRGYNLEEAVPAGSIIGVFALLFRGAKVNHEDLRHELHDCNQHTMVLVLQKTNNPINKVFYHVGTLGKASSHGETSLLSEVSHVRLEVLIYFGSQVT
mmetsp:Transcript_15425/g.29438  ORF Transcript_15425/g.29438 Transcript_15425/m.29438 type:complete len:267 (-) Transcript_15425:571-1371(-)